MKTARVEITVLEAGFVSLENRKELILSLGKQFALRFGLATPDDVELKSGQKPYFDSKSIFLSISHSGSYWVCAISDSQIGMDIQIHKQCNWMQIARRFFNADEILWLNKKSIDAFFLIWTAKESYVKFTGEGINDHFGDFTVVSDDKITCCNGAYLEHKSFSPDYSLCICTAARAEVILLNSNV